MIFIPAVLGLLGGLIFGFGVLNFDDRKYLRFAVSYAGFIIAVLAQHL